MWEEETAVEEGTRDTTPPVGRRRRDAGGGATKVVSVVSERPPRDILLAVRLVAKPYLGGAAVLLNKLAREALRGRALINSTGRGLITAVITSEVV